jgi:hypothetical protein
LYSDGAGDIDLLDRTSFHQLKGFNEIFRVTSVSLNEDFAVKAYATGYPIQSLGAPVYHILEAQGVTAGDGRKTPSQHRHTRVTYRNPDTWGLSGASERRLASDRIWLDFDWAAVPPLVDLSGVVLTPDETGCRRTQSLRVSI